MSPEQIDGMPTDPRSDVFSLGVLLCEAVTGTNPFARPGVLETLRAIGETPAPAVGVTKNLPPGVSAVVLKALQRDPASRYQTSAELAADLELALADLEAPVRHRATRARTRYAVAAALVLVVTGGAVGGVAYRRAERRVWVREQAMPEIIRLTSAEQTAAAVPLIQAAEGYLPGNADLGRVVDEATRVASIHSSPDGAVIEVKDYAFPNEGWLRLGVTPLEKTRIPRGVLRWRVSKEGVGESVSVAAPLELLNFDLERAAKAPPGMVAIDDAPWGDYLAFLGLIGSFGLPPYFIDRFEVTNREYQVFIDKGGYSTQANWKQPFRRDGRELTWAEAMDLFRDSTGRPGPSTWEGGHYPEGKGDFPVSGVSWFEAEAYAEFAGKSLPVIAQWGKSAPYELDKYLIPLSNLSTTLAPVGQFQGLGPFGTYDTIGNAREWSWNATGDGLRFLFGRQPASYGPEALNPFDRSPLNGFRCVLNMGPLPDIATAPRTMLRRDFSRVTPVTDDVFRVYRNIYAYDKGPLGAVVETVPDPSEDWTRLKVTFNAAYGNERMWAFLFLPKHSRPPFQTVIFFPSARVNLLPSSDALGDLSFMDYVVKSGRAVIYPIY
jgi:hypothetical protein